MVIGLSAGLAPAEAVSWAPPGTASASAGATFGRYSTGAHGAVTGLGGSIDGEAGLQLGNAPASITVFLRLAVLQGSSDSGVVRDTPESATVVDGFAGARVAFVSGRAHGDVGLALLVHHAGYADTNDGETEVGGALQLRFSFEVVRYKTSAIELGVDGMLGTFSIDPTTNGVLTAATVWVGIRGFDRSY